MFHASYHKYLKKPCYEQHEFINTLSSSLSCLLLHRCIHTHIIVFILCYVIGHFASIIANIIIYAHSSNWEFFFFFSMLHNLLIDTLSALKSFENTVKA